MLMPAPPLQASAWLNTPRPLALADFAGRVLMIEAFQMLCPGCVATGLPQAQRVHAQFDPREVAVIGLHSVFEHHAAQGSSVALTAFAHEYRLDFPIAIDAAGEPAQMPLTMAAYAMRGTPTLVLIDRAGRRRMQHFGHIEDLKLGSAIAALLAEPVDGCTVDGCAVPAIRQG